MFNYEGSNAELLNCTFIGNLAGSTGGAIYNWNSSPILTNCVFSGNSAAGDGGVMAIYFGSLGGFIPCKLINCTFTGNSSGQYGGGIWFVETSLILTNCTFVANSALGGNALACSRYPSNVQITNCILWNGGDEVWNDAGSTITMTYSDVQDGWPGEGNINVDPCFVDNGYWDAGGVWIDGNYHLLPDSPCINTAIQIIHTTRTRQI